MAEPCGDFAINYQRPNVHPLSFPKAAILLAKIHLPHFIPIALRMILQYPHIKSSIPNRLRIPIYQSSGRKDFLPVE
ncbi:MAG: hypothetical protein WB696_17545, partial [Chthoniobacterales bacterium]